jgi:hypothetical protein
MTQGQNIFCFIYLRKHHTDNHYWALITKFYVAHYLFFKTFLLLVCNKTGHSFSAVITANKGKDIA